MRLRFPALLAAALLLLAGLWFLLAPRSLQPPGIQTAKADAPPAPTSAANPDANASDSTAPAAANTARATPSPPASAATQAANASPTAAAPAPRNPRPPRSVADILENAGDLSDPAVRERAIEAMRAFRQERRAAAEARALELGLPLRTVGPNGRVRILHDFDAEGRPIYRTTLNLNAARSSGASQLQAETPPLSGSSVIVGVWDAGLVRTTHQELTGRVTAKNTADTDDHATHVAGTVGASGVVASARGMAPAVSIHSYDWEDDYAEMTAAGATADGQTTRIYLSNHSYGAVNGWDPTGEASPEWRWYGSGTTASSIDPEFGQYNTGARDVDAVADATPYLLSFYAAGNDGTDNPANGELVSLSSTGTTTVSYNSANHPAGDGLYRGGYDTIAWDALGKNVLTVGASTDAVTSSQRDVAQAAVVDFSSWGPTDDGRIKPDLLANGDGIHSPVAFNVSNGSTSNTAYDTYSGTSMAAPSAAGSAALLVQLYGQLFPGSALRASTLKALLLHTADDLGTAGPDYKNGWGLINVKAAADLLRDHAAHPLRLRVNEAQLNTTTTTVTHEFTWDGVSPLRATLCWTDPAGPATTSGDSRTSRLVNNLDLKILGPDDSTHLPWVMPFVGTWTQASMALAATRGENDTDNVEQVFIATPPAAGTYRAVVSHRGTLSGGLQHYGLIISGSTSAPAPAVAPAITTHPVSQSVSAGASVTFTVAAAGTAPLTYQWRKGGTAIPNATNPTYTLTNVQPADTGSYDVVVANATGSAASNTATLTVAAITSSTVTWNFTSSAAPSSALPTGVSGGTITQGNNFGTTALFDGVAASSGYSGASGGNNAAMAARTGTLNTANGGSAYFTFTFTPEAGKRLVVTSVAFGMRRANTGPQAWALYSSVDNYAAAIATGTQTTATTWALFTPTISPVTGALGTPVTFRLYGYNGTGSASVNTANWRMDDLAVAIAVQTAPTITTPPAAQTVAAGTDVTFTVTAAGTDPLSYQWRRNGTPLSGATSASHTLTNVQAAQAGSYDVVVTNVAGSATSAAATLSVLSGFDAWQLGHFDAAERADPQVSGPNAVLTADGLTNLLKYALGHAPRATVTSLGELTAPAGQLQFTYTRPADRSELTYVVELSTDLVSWSSGSVTHELIATGSGTETWRASTPLAAGSRAFLRLRVTRP